MDGALTRIGALMDEMGQSVASSQVEGRKQAPTLIEGQVHRAGVWEVRRQSVQCR